MAAAAFRSALTGQLRAQMIHFVDVNENVIILQIGLMTGMSICPPGVVRMQVKRFQLSRD